MTPVTVDDVRLCRDIAQKAHAGMLKRGTEEAYFEGHVMKVAGALTNQDQEYECVAYLHDVVEDCSACGYDAASLLGMGVPEGVLVSVLRLTKLKGQDYAEYIRRLLASRDVVAITVKLADLTVNIATTKECLAGCYDSNADRKQDEARLLKYELSRMAVEATLALMKSRSEWLALKAETDSTRF